MDCAVEQQAWLWEAKNWRRLCDFYRTKGEVAWNKRPYQVTSMPKIAPAYCEMILAFLADWLLQHGAFSYPHTIVQLGVEQGGFANFKRAALAERVADFARPGVSYRYLITDNGLGEQPRATGVAKSAPSGKPRGSLALSAERGLPFHWCASNARFEHASTIWIPFVSQEWKILKSGR